MPETYDGFFTEFIEGGYFLPHRCEQLKTALVELEERVFLADGNSGEVDKAGSEFAYQVDGHYFDFFSDGSGLLCLARIAAARQQINDAVWRFVQGKLARVVEMPPRHFTEFLALALENLQGNADDKPPQLLRDLVQLVEKQADIVGLTFASRQRLEEFVSKATQGDGVTDGQVDRLAALLQRLPEADESTEAWIKSILPGGSPAIARELLPIVPTRLIALDGDEDSRLGVLLEEPEELLSLGHSRLPSVDSWAKQAAKSRDRMPSLVLHLFARSVALTSYGVSLQDAKPRWTYHRRNAPEAHAHFIQADAFRELAKVLLKKKFTWPRDAFAQLIELLPAIMHRGSPSAAVLVSIFERFAEQAPMSNEQRQRIDDLLAKRQSSVDKKAIERWNALKASQDTKPIQENAPEPVAAAPQGPPTPPPEDLPEHSGPYISRSSEGRFFSDAKPTDPADLWMHGISKDLGDRWHQSDQARRGHPIALLTALLSEDVDTVLERAGGRRDEGDTSADFNPFDSPWLLALSEAGEATRAAVADAAIYDVHEYSLADAEPIVFASDEWSEWLPHRVLLATLLKSRLPLTDVALRRLARIVCRPEVSLFVSPHQLAVQTRACVEYWERSLTEPTRKAVAEAAMSVQGRLDRDEAGVSHQDVSNLFVVVDRNEYECGLTLGEPWADSVVKELFAMKRDQAAPYWRFLKHCGSLSGVKPTNKWLTGLAAVLEASDQDEVIERVTRWVYLIDGRGGISKSNGKILNGIVWALSTLDSIEIVYPIGHLAIVSLQDNEGRARSERSGNSAIRVLGQLPYPWGYIRLRDLQHRVRTKKTGELIEEAIAAANGQQNHG